VAHDRSNELQGKSNERLMSRRKFFTRISIITGAIAGALVATPVIGFIFAPLIRPDREIWRPVGDLNDFEIGRTVKVTFPDAKPLRWSGQTGENSAWLQRRGEDEFVAYSIYCTHLGCPVFWLGDAELFMCPCHGGVFYADGEVAVEPPQEPLVRFPLRLRDGQVEIRTASVEIET
jgi:menaquinol-cytochrome c reductase iron-sulfur subunit